MITPTPITAKAFAPFGQLIEVNDGPFALINAGMCKRFNDLCAFDIVDGQVGLSLFNAQVRQTPYTCDLLERHPLGSQAFVPMGNSGYLVIVAPDAGNKPGIPRVFYANGQQSINIARNTWHGVLAPVSGNGLFAVLDCITDGNNLEEHRLETPLLINIPGH